MIQPELDPSAITIDVIPVDFDDPEVVTLVERQVRDLASRRHVDPWPLGDPAKYRFPDGIFLLARVDDVPAGCCGMRKTYKANVGEVKRIWTEPRFRRLRVASAMLDILEEVWAFELGFTDLILSADEVVPEAIALFESRGWQAAPKDPRYGFWARALMYTKHLPD